MNKRVVNKILVIGLHVCGWSLLYIAPFRFIARIPELFIERMPSFKPGGVPPQMDLSDFDPSWLRIESVVTTTLLAIFFYINIYLLIPRILNRRGWLFYLTIVALALMLYLAAGYLLRSNFSPPAMARFNPPFFMGVSNFLVIFGLSFALRITEDRTRLEGLLKEQENERLKSELSFLRSQVSPHFMFNVLNSLASLARKKSDQVESAIIQLSQLMRYSLYQLDAKVSLEQEAEYLNNYIELQRLRFGAFVNMHFQVNIEKRDLKIEPMLLVSFVENAFKHGVGMIENPVIIIILEASAYQISFTVRNKFNHLNNEVKDSSSGIGLQNVRRRLDLLYRNMYTLNSYTTDDHWFVTELKITPE